MNEGWLKTQPGSFSQKYDFQPPKVSVISHLNTIHGCGLSKTLHKIFLQSNKKVPFYFPNNDFLRRLLNSFPNSSLMVAFVPEMFRKTFSESHCFCLKPTTQYIITERILCSIVCLNVYKDSKNFFSKPLFLLEAHHSVYFHRTHTLFNCMFECVYCFKKLLLKVIVSAWIPPLTVLWQSAYFVQLYV